MKTISIGNVKIGAGQLLLIAGPCIIESAEHAAMMAASLKKITSSLNIPFVFKASFDKANRSSINGFRGPGLEQGLKILSDIKTSLNIPVISDIHEPFQAAPAAEVLDILQVPAFLCRQTDLLVAAGNTGKPVNVKKGQFMAPWDMANVIKKIQSTGNDNIILTERGASFGYNNLVCDLRSLGFMRSLGYPVVLDATHSLQLPGGKGDSSSGNRDFIAPLARAGVAFGVDGIFMEVHNDPDNALSDAANSLNLDDLEELLTKIERIHRIIQ